MLTRSSLEHSTPLTGAAPQSPDSGMRVGIFGGSFNPPHIAHLLIAELVREEFALDEVAWIVSARPPHKDALSLASAADRVAMVNLAIEENPYFSSSDVEIRREGPSYTIETLRILRAHRPDADLFLLLGGDSLVDFKTWKDPEAILDEAQLVVFHRTGNAPPRQLMRPDRIHFSTFPCIDVSSSDVRDRIRRGMSIRYLVPSGVRTYIAQHGLYGSSSAGLNR